MASESSDFSEQLIEEVRACRCIWDVASAEYRDSGRKNNAWTGISERLGLPGKEKEVKEKWKRLRDSYLRAKRTSKGRSGDPASKRPKWQFYEAMSFVQTTIECGISTSNFTLEQVETHADMESENTPSTEVSLNPLDMEDERQATFSGRKVPKKRNTPTSEIGLVEREFLKKLHGINTPQSPEELFGVMVGKTLASLPQTIAIEAKMKIQQILYESELLARSNNVDGTDI